MNKHREHITVFEHEIIRFDKGEKRISHEQYKTLQNYYGEGVPYYNLCYNGVHFNEYVGVIQIGNTIIEVLPKADKTNLDETRWRKLLIGMLKAVGSFDIKVSSESNLKIKPNTILDLYIEMFIKEVEYLLHNGLVKKYRKKESNINTLKGNLQFAKQIQQNITHQERFFVRHTTFDIEHILHFIIYKTILLLNQINTNSILQSRIGALLLNFPEMPVIKINEGTFSKIVYNRKTQFYKKSIEIARLLLLQYHPDLIKGSNHVLALMFDMNSLWEKFVYMSLKKIIKGIIPISAQTSKHLWQSEYGSRTKIRPDIVINNKHDNCVVLDTKWKQIADFNPSTDDLRQMYVYHKYYQAKRVALIYPGSGYIRKGNYFKPEDESISNMECSVITIPTNESISLWQEEIAKQIFQEWLKGETLIAVNN